MSGPAERMNRQHIDAARKALEEVGFTEVKIEAVVARFIARKNGGEVIVCVEDRGNAHPENRFMCHGRDETGRVAAGNAFPDPRTAVVAAHWSKLNPKDAM